MRTESELKMSAAFGGPRQGLVASLLKSFVGGLKFGQITVVLPGGDRLEYSAPGPGPSATLVLLRWRAIWRLVSQGDLGFAEAYVDGDWSSPDLALLLELAARNITVLDRKMYGFRPFRIRTRFQHLRRANSKAGSRKNISFHYDLGNAFYQRWLDPGMIYSSALYTHPGQSLEDAQAAKLTRIEQLLDLRGGEQILEIGCGWGALALRLAASGMNVTGVTLSKSQLTYAQRKVERAGFADKVKLSLTDYRDVEGAYDRIVSIEMIEAVGEAYWPLYFKTLHDRLRPGGIVVLQAITIDESRFQSYRRSADFIQRHIFPGGMLLTKAAIVEQAEKAGLEVISTQTFGQDYARTLADWRSRFLTSWPEIEPLGFPESFRRLWEYYLSYCEGGFKAGTIDVGFYVLAKARQASPRDAA